LLQAFEESADWALLSSFCGDSNQLTCLDNGEGFESISRFFSKPVVRNGGGSLVGGAPINIFQGRASFYALYKMLSLINRLFTNKFICFQKLI